MRHHAPIVSCGPLARIDGFRGMVHAAFPSAIYLEPLQGPMMVLHDAAHGHTPTSVLVAGARELDWSIRNGDAVIGRAGVLRVGSLLFDATHAPRWQPPAPPTTSPSLARPSNPSPPQGQGTAGASRWWNSSSSSSSSSSRPTPAPLAEAEARVAAACQQLLTPLAEADGTGVPGALRALIGAGPGLTPSGDDALVGILAVLHRARRIAPVTIPLTIPIGMISRHLPGLLGRTTPISAHYLRLAVEGHIGEHLTALIDTDLTLGPDNTGAGLIDRVLRTGATSGADVLVAVSLALSFIDQLRQRCPTATRTTLRSAA